jgi:hypothetical protein
VWADATLFCLRPLDEWLPPNHTMDHTTGFTAFRDPSRERLMANWFIAAEPTNPILAALHREFTSFMARHAFPNQNAPETVLEIERLAATLNADVESTLGWFEPGLIERLGAHPRAGSRRGRSRADAAAKGPHAGAEIRLARRCRVTLLGARAGRIVRFGVPPGSTDLRHCDSLLFR